MSRCMPHADDIEFDPWKSVEFWNLFDANGSALYWSSRPKLTVIVDEGRKQRLPRADGSPFTAEGLVFNARARDALGDFLVQFGQLLELDVDGGVEYYYNVTHVLACLDHERLTIEAGYVEKAVFRKSVMPDDLVLFIEPSITARIFVNDAAKAALEARIARHSLIGMSFAPRNVA